MPIKYAIPKGAKKVQRWNEVTRLRGVGIGQTYCGGTVLATYYGIARELIGEVGWYVLQSVVDVR